MQQQLKVNLRQKKNPKESLDDLVAPLLVAKKDAHSIHKLFAYPAKFQSQLPKALIEVLTEPGDLVCDPYSGGGTTASTSAMLGRQCYAIDLNPIAVMISKAKTTPIDRAAATRIVQKLKSLTPKKNPILLTKEEMRLMGDTLGPMAEAVWQHIENSPREKGIYLLATVLFKRIKMASRRDKTHLRTASFDAHIEYLSEEIFEFANASGNEEMVPPTVDFGSNHDMALKKASVDLIVTSPPYPGVDVEYNLIQLRRRDLNKCYRSDIGVRLATTILQRSTSVVKKDLCDGGSAGNYWSNTQLSLAEMHRVLKAQATAFLYVGFKTELDRARFEKLCNTCGFTLERRFTVQLGKERVASSRGLYHGKETAMMKMDYLYMLRKK